MIVYHGTSSKHLNSIVFYSGMKKNTWFALHKWHGFQLAERTSKRDGGTPVVLEIETKSLDRVMGRNKPSFKYLGGIYIIKDILVVSSFISK